MKQGVNKDNIIKILLVLAETNDMITHLTKIVQEQNQIIADLKKDVDVLKKQTVKRRNLSSGGYIITKL